MKIVSNKTWNAVLDLISEKDKQIENLENICKRQINLIEAQRRFISARISHLDTTHDIDFPNSERKEDYESSNIFDL